MISTAKVSTIAFQATFTPRCFYFSLFLIISNITHLSFCLSIVFQYLTTNALTKTVYLQNNNKYCYCYLTKNMMPLNTLTFLILSLNSLILILCSPTPLVSIFQWWFHLIHSTYFTPSFENCNRFNIRYDKVKKKLISINNAHYFRCNVILPVT